MREQVAAKVLEALGYKEAAKKKLIIDWFPWAVSAFRAFYGLKDTGLSQEFMDHLDFVARIEQVGKYDPIRHKSDCI